MYAHATPFRHCLQSNPLSRIQNAPVLFQRKLMELPADTVQRLNRDILLKSDQIPKVFKCVYTHFRFSV